MKVFVLGAGVTGISTAYYLAQDGHEVTVIDRRSGAAMEASAASGGEIAPSCAYPKAAPGMRFRLLKAMLRNDPGLRIQKRFDAALGRWLRAWMRECDAEHFRRNTERMQRLARYSLNCLQTLRRATPIEYAQNCNGMLQLMRTARELKTVLEWLPLLEQSGTPYTVLDPVGCISVDPALEHAWAPFTGGLYLPIDETGDCALFTRLLAECAQARGVSFRYDTTIEALQIEGNALSGVRTAKEVLRADRYVLALAGGGGTLLKQAGLRLNLQNVKGYSAILPLADAERAPRGGVFDMRNDITITRLGEQLRIAGNNEIGNASMQPQPERCRKMLESFNELYPYAADLGKAQYSVGLCTSTPDGSPILGRTPIDRLLVNIGHGSEGWTMACGSAKIISDLIAERDPDIDIEGLGWRHCDA